MENSSQPQIKNLARQLLVRLAQSNDDRQRATALLEEILLESTGFFPKDTILLQLAQNHEAAGNAQEAVVFYQRLTTEYPGSVYLQEARTHLEQLEGGEQLTAVVQAGQDRGSKGAENEELGLPGHPR